MAQCKWCDKNGFFLKLNANGLCKECNPIIVESILENVEKYKKSIKELNHYFSPKNGLKLIDTIKHSLALLKQYEDKGIPTIEPLASKLFEEKIFGSSDESLDEIEKRLIIERDKLNINILTLNTELYGDGIYSLKGDFIFNNELKAYTQGLKIKPEYPKFEQSNLAAILLDSNYSSGTYREYYPSGKLFLEIPFTKCDDRNNFQAHGIVKKYYEGEDGITLSDVYVLRDEMNFLNGSKIGLQKTYGTNGQLYMETMYESLESNEKHEIKTKFYKTYYASNGNLFEEVFPDWGKKYYENGKLLAEWKSNDYSINGEYVEVYSEGSIKMKVNYIDGNRDGLMHKYYPNGKIMELWSYDKGKRKFVKKYFESGMLKTEFLYDNDGNEITKKYYDFNGNLKKKN